MSTRSVAAFGLVLLAAASASAQTPAQPPPSDGYDEAFVRYLQEARKPLPPSIDWNWMTGLASDRRARRPNDVVTIKVVENISASGTADAALGKTSGSNVALTGLAGVERKLSPYMDPTALIDVKSDNQFKGTGSTNRAGVLTAVLSARVADVLPNGDLVVEGVREIEINGDRQIVVLTGVVRVADITSDNVVMSTQIAQMRIRYFGRGLMKDNLKPGFLVRVLNKIF